MALRKPVDGGISAFSGNSGGSKFGGKVTYFSARISTWELKSNAEGVRTIAEVARAAYHAARGWFRAGQDSPGPTGKNIHAGSTQLANHKGDVDPEASVKRRTWRGGR